MLVLLVQFCDKWDNHLQQVKKIKRLGTYTSNKVMILGDLFHISTAASSVKLHTMC